MTELSENSRHRQVLDLGRSQVAAGMQCPVGAATSLRSRINAGEVEVPAAARA